MNKLESIRREYGGEVCDTASLKACPIEQFNLWLQVAIESEVMDPTAMVLSTVSETGEPDARVVLLKEVITSGFVFYTHSLSAKGKQLHAHPRCALTFYWPPLARQVRIKGTVQRVEATAAQQYFDSRPYASQISSLISSQSQVVASRHALEAAFQAAKAQYPEGKVPVPEDWQGYCVVPSSIEFWQGRDNRLHDRILYTQQQTGWVKVRLAP